MISHQTICTPVSSTTATSTSAGATTHEPRTTHSTSWKREACRPVHRRDLRRCQLAEPAPEPRIVERSLVVAAERTARRSRVLGLRAHRAPNLRQRGGTHVNWFSADDLAAQRAETV